MVRQAVRSRSTSEKLVVLVYILMACLAVAHASYYAYSSYYEQIHTDHPGLTLNQYYRLHTTTPVSADHPLFSGTDHAPNQYRIGIAYPVKFLAEGLSIRRFYILYVSIDFVCAVAICLLFYSSLCRSAFFQGLSPQWRTTAVAFFLASLIFPFAWVVPWQRPETLPTGLYLALIFTLLDRVRSYRLWFAAILLATLWQAFIRADVPAIFGLALAFFSLTPRAAEMLGSRKFGVAAGLAIAAIAIAVQTWLKLILFPHATYAPDTPVIQFFSNLKIRTLTTFVIAMLPYMLVLGVAARHWKRMDPEDILAIFASCIYLPLWWTVGVTGEVRIFVPFLLALTPAAAKLMVLLLDTEIVKGSVN